MSEPDVNDKWTIRICLGDDHRPGCHHTHQSAPSEGLCPHCSDYEDGWRDAMDARARSLRGAGGHPDRVAPHLSVPWRFAAPVGEMSEPLTAAIDAMSDSLNALDAALDDTHPEGDGCDICNVADELPSRWATVVGLATPAPSEGLDKDGFMVMRNAARHDFSCKWSSPGVIDAEKNPCTCGLADDIAALLNARQSAPSEGPETPTGRWFRETYGARGYITAADLKDKVRQLAHLTPEDWQERRGADPIARTINAVFDIIDEYSAVQPAPSEGLRDIAAALEAADEYITDTGIDSDGMDPAANDILTLIARARAALARQEATE